MHMIVENGQYSFLLQRIGSATIDNLNVLFAN